MKRNTRNSYVLMAAGAAAILLGGGVAFAFWTSSGTGSGTAAAGTTDSVDISQVGSITGLYPGGPGQTISIDAAYVDERLAPLARNQDLSRYIL